MANEVKTQLRLPTELHGQVKRLADEDLRSLNAEIVILLREALQARGVESAAPRREEPMPTTGIG